MGSSDSVIPEIVGPTVSGVGVGVMLSVGDGVMLGVGVGVMLGVGVGVNVGVGRAGR